MIIRNVTRNRVLCARGREADTFLLRAKGLMFTRDWAGFDGLLLDPCGSIHTFCMRMAIDVCFLDKAWIVRKGRGDLGPWRVASGGRGCHSTLELPAGTLKETGTMPGDRLERES